MHNPNVGSFTRQSSANLHQTARVTRHHSVNTSALDRFDLLVKNRDRDLRVLHRKGPTKAATRIGMLEFDKLRATHVSNQSSGLSLQIEIAQTVTRVMPR